MVLATSYIDLYGYRGVLDKIFVLYIRNYTYFISKAKYIINH